MADSQTKKQSKPVGKRQPTAATLYRHIVDYIDITDNIGVDGSIDGLLASLKDTIVKEATGR